MLERQKNLSLPGQYILFKIDHLDFSIQRKIEALREAIERIEPGTNVDLYIKVTLRSERRDTHEI
jgi:hypothetical protein